MSFPSVLTRSVPLIFLSFVLLGYILNVFLFSSSSVDSIDSSAFTHSKAVPLKLVQIQSAEIGNNPTNDKQTPTDAALTPDAADASAVAVALYSPDPAAVPLEFFVMSQCPDYHSCARRFLPSLAPIFPIIRLKLNFIVYPKAGNRYNCMHGTVECDGNRVQLCAQQQLQDVLNHGNGPDSASVAPLDPAENAFLPSAEPLENRLPAEAAHFFFEQYLQFLLCMNNKGQNMGACTGEHIRAEPLRKCLMDQTSHTPGSSVLMGESARRVEESNRKRSCTILMEGQFWCRYDGGQFWDCKEGENGEALIQAVCRRYKGEQKIEACNKK